jgi:hypothetical protein
MSEPTSRPKLCKRCGAEKTYKRTDSPTLRCATCKRQEATVVHGLTLERYEAMLAAQGGVCAICKRPETIKVHGKVVAMSIDHDHNCCPTRGRSCRRCVRGLLCRRCNILIGFLRNSVELLPAIAAYFQNVAAWRESVGIVPRQEAQGAPPDTEMKACQPDAQVGTLSGSDRRVPAGGSGCYTSHSMCGPVLP